VTGACSGIGLAMARRLGSLGYDLILVSPRLVELTEAAGAIRREHGTTVHPVVLDLARPEAAAELYDAARNLDVEVDILVNNAGFFFFGEVADADPARANAMLQLHVVTPSLLSTLFGRDMRSRGRGHILFVSSISAWRDFPGIAYYGSSKKYLRGFARSLRSELGVHGVNVTCLAPGATATGLYDPDVVPVERAGLHAMFAGRAELVPGRLTRVMASAAAWTPQWAIDLIRRRAPWLPKGGAAR
jgi:short-subunit dehydrogenase